MWSDTKQQQLDELRQRRQHGGLTSDEQQALDQLLHELEQQEWLTLRPALDQLRQNQGQIHAQLSQIQTQTALMSALSERYADLVFRARTQLAELVSEREALRAEYDRVLQS